MQHELRTIHSGAGKIAGKIRTCFCEIAVPFLSEEKAK
jgi:hypothetical protein